MGNESWLELIDLEKSAQGDVTLKYEDAAFAVLKTAKEKMGSDDPDAEKKRLRLESFAWNFLKLQPEEFVSIQEYVQIATATEVTGPHLKAVFEVLLKRANLLKSDENPTGWKVTLIERGVTLTVKASAKEIVIPQGQLEALDTGLWGLPHELLHILRGENGSRQDVSLLQAGTVGYGTTDEGLAILTELLAGEPFGHERQLELAARYYAIALSLKTKVAENGQREARYTTQEIYNVLREHDVAEDIATAILWRINRGTSLKRNVVELPVVADGKTQTLPIAETFVKDTIYFEGQMAIYDFMKSLVPWSEAELEKPIVKNSQDLNRRMLARIGYSIRNQFMGGSATGQKDANMGWQDLYNVFVQLGQEAVYQIIDYLSAGKMKLEELKNPDWQKIIKREDLVSFKDFFTPVSKK